MITVTIQVKPYLAAYLAKRIRALYHRGCHPFHKKSESLQLPTTAHHSPPQRCVMAGSGKYHLFPTLPQCRERIHEPTII